VNWARRRCCSSAAPANLSKTSTNVSCARSTCMPCCSTKGSISCSATAKPLPLPILKARAS